jgi:DNA-binding LytR/AlgR family response regulator
LEHTGRERRRQIVLKTDDGYRSINIREIIYTESHGKNQIISIEKKPGIIVRMTSIELFELLSPYANFVRCGAAYILNIAHIHTLDSKTVKLKNGTAIGIPRGAYPELKARYLAFFTKEGN